MSNEGELAAQGGSALEGARDQRSAQALIASEKQYRRLFETAKDGILILDGDSGDIIDVNPFLLELTGYARADCLGKHLWDLGLLKDVAANKASFAELKAREYVRHDDLPLEGRDGRRVDVEFVSNVYWVDQRKIIQCNIRDITERKRRESEHRRLTTAIEQLAEMVLITDAKGDILFVNPAFEDVTGYTRAEVLGSNPRLLKSGAQSPVFYQDLWATLSAGKTFHGRMVNRKKDGTLYTEDATISPVRETGGVISSYVSVKRDVTRELALEAQFLQSQKMDAIGQLAAGIAHDFNNLLVVIITFSELMLEGLSSQDSNRADLEEIKKAGERAATLTRQLLAFSREQVIDPKPVNLTAVVAGMEKMLQRLIGADIEVTTREVDDLGLVNADFGQIEQVLMNLAVNARDAMPNGGRLILETSNVRVDEAYLRSHLGLTQLGPHVLLSVKDTGSGMSKEIISHIFEPFFTTKGQGKGTGLGLSTVFGVVKQFGGTILVQSELGHGSTFELYFPRCESAKAEAPTVAEASPRGHETILLVDDEAGVRSAAQRILVRDGYRVLVAQSASEALRLCRSEAEGIDLLLSDVVMPIVNGPALADLLLAIHPDLRVLFMSGYTDEVVAGKFSGWGAAFIQKPFTPDGLSKKVREVLSVTTTTQDPGLFSETNRTETAVTQPPAELEVVTSQGSSTPGGAMREAPRATRSAERSHVAMGTLSGRVLLLDVPEWRQVHSRVLLAAGVQADVVSDAASTFEKAKEGYDVVIIDMAMSNLDGGALVRAMRQVDPDLAVILIVGRSDAEAVRSMDLSKFRSITKPVSSHDLLDAIQEALQVRRIARLTGDALHRFGDRKTDIGNIPERRRAR